MDDTSEHSKRELPNTPRVCDKIIQYYQEFALDHDLKKFMRLYSPISNPDTENTRGTDSDTTPTLGASKPKECRPPISSINTSEDFDKMTSRPLSNSCVTNSKSLPNIDVQGQQKIGYFPSNEVIVDISVDAAEKNEKILSISSDNLRTPKKTFKNTKTQTPESVAKTHRRLEWDSLGDVGYKKSMSTSNISTMERSLLKEFFKENSAASEPGSDVLIKELQHVTNGNKILKKLKSTDLEHNEHGTPPLACSTLVATTGNGAKPKMMSQSTSSTSLNEKFEKYAQTSFIKPSIVRSQEVQCTLSSSSSMIECTSTPSSFEYYSSRSSKSSDVLIKTNGQKQCKPMEHPFITSITELLMKRKALGEKNEQSRHHNIHELQTKFHAALNENKENQSHTVSSFSLSKQAPELDLGIQLICALIDAKSINGRQKKELIRDIIKRLTRVEAEDQTSFAAAGNNSGTTTTNSSDCQRQHIYDSIRSSIKNRQEIMLKLKGSSELGVAPIKSGQANTQENSSTSNTSTNENVSDILCKKTNDHSNSNIVNFQKHQDKNGCKQFVHKTNLSENSQKQNNTKVSNEAAATINKATQSELIIVERVNKQKPTNTKASEIKNLKTSVSNTRTTNRCTQTSRTSLISTSSTTTPDLTTQKTRNSELNNNSITDVEESTMREWLNPLTQSEIEYEEKKRLEMRQKALTQNEILKKKSKNDCVRIQQLNWIENEIKRLECLKHLLLKDDTSTTSVSSYNQASQNNLNKDSMQTDKLYDTVHSEKSSVLSKSAEELVQEIEIILEESHEDAINVKDNRKCTKDRKKETQILYEGVKDCVNQTKTKPKFRIINENINFHEEQLLNGRKSEKEKIDIEINSKQQQQREKIATPSSGKSEDCATLRDLVQQRKREFMAAYKTKKHHHYEAPKQQQKDDYKDLNIQSKPSEKTTTTTDSEHYSVPHTLPRKNVANASSYCTQQPLSLTPLKKEGKIKTYNPMRDHLKICTTTSINKRQSVDKVIYTSSGNTNNTTTTSSSSMFCVSSDVSVPMGSQNSSSTSTTTHQYDDVAAVAGVAVQTCDSIMRSKPIYGPTLLPYTATTFSSTACVQVKPKGIAYVIEFDDNKHAISNPTSDIELNSNDVSAKSNKRSNRYSSAQVARKSKPESLLTLQEHLEKGKPKFLQHSKERKAILNELQLMRQERDRQLRQIIDNTSFKSLDRRLQYLPPPAMQKVRILNTKEMKALTNKRFASLPEVVAKQEREIEEKKRRSNRILRDVFNKRLQKRVRSGKLSLNHSRTVI